MHQSFVTTTPTVSYHTPRDEVLEQQGNLQGSDFFIVRTGDVSGRVAISFKAGHDCCITGRVDQAKTE